jgi:hypothetical protein
MASHLRDDGMYKKQLVFLLGAILLSSASEAAFVGPEALNLKVSIDRSLSVDSSTLGGFSINHPGAAIEHLAESDVNRSMATPMPAGAWLSGTALAGFLVIGRKSREYTS